MRGARLAPLALGFACGAAPEKSAEHVDSAVRDSGGGAPAAHVFEPAPPPPPRSLSDLAAGLDAGLEALAALRPAALHEAQVAAMAAGDGACPGLFPSVGEAVAWSADCVTPGGWAYSGRAQAAWERERAIEGVEYIEFGEFISTATYGEPSGGRLGLDGRGAHRRRREGAGERWEASLIGSFWAEPGGGGWPGLPWLESGPSLALDWVGIDAGGGAWTLSIEGGLSGGAAAAGGLLGLRAEGLQLTVEGGACAASGGLVLLGPAGDRYALALAGDCGACAEVMGPDGAILGELCPALGPLWAGGRPW